MTPFEASGGSHCKRIEVELWGVVMGGACSSGAVRRENKTIVMPNTYLNLYCETREIIISWRTFSVLTNLF